MEKRQFRYPQGFKIEQSNSRVYLPKAGWVNYIKSREIIGKEKNITVSEKCGHFFCKYLNLI